MPTSLSSLVAHEFSTELSDAFGRIKHCVDQLTDAQVWWRSSEKMNSIGNLMLHLAGNVRQWIIAGVGGAPDTRVRQAEFDQRKPISKIDLISNLAGTVDEAKAVMHKVDEPEWQRMRRIQSYEVSSLGAALHSVSHFRGHTQEIIHLARTILGDSYQFAFVPKTKEQGAL